MARAPLNLKKKKKKRKKEKRYSRPNLIWAKEKFDLGPHSKKNFYQLGKLSLVNKKKKKKAKRKEKKKGCYLLLLTVLTRTYQKKSRFPIQKRVILRYSWSPRTRTMILHLFIFMVESIH